MRIIAGTLKGRRLAAPTWDGLRPTSDKLRETLFNVIAPRMENARFLRWFCRYRCCRPGRVEAAAPRT